MAWNYSSITQIDLRENENGIRNKIGSHTKTFISKISDFFYIGKSMDFIHNSSIVFVWPAISILMPFSCLRGSKWVTEL